jgi:16S rRNA (cytosine1402-N4)-methyltransferase
VLLDEVLAALDPRPGDSVVDCTLGYGGHAVEFLKRVGPSGKLIGFDLDAGNLPGVRDRLAQAGHPFSLHHGNFAGLTRILGDECPDGCDVILADLGMSSMQVDDAGRGFSYQRDGPLDMRMDRSRGRTAAELLATLPADELAAAFRDLGDEMEADAIAAAIVERREESPIERTRELMALIQEAAPVKVNPRPLPGEPKPWQQKIRPVARVFQALRILVNRELANLTELLRVLPLCLKPGGRAGIITFHSGEDRLVKAAFKEGLRAGTYSEISDEPIRATYEERGANPRSRSAKLRVGKKV